LVLVSKVKKTQITNTKCPLSRFSRVVTGEFDPKGYDCGRTALYIFGFIEAPESPIPSWNQVSLNLEPITEPEDWCLAIYQEQIFNHIGIVA